MNAAAPLVECRGVEVRYGGDLALADLDLAIAVGERLAILGPNGGGKTTLARLLLGLLPPNRGRVVWHRAAAARRLAHVPQSPSFDRSFPIRVADMVRHGLLAERRASGRRGSAALGEREEGLLAALDLEALSGAYLSELSGGELKRALIARALVGRPDFLVLDEPTASLDEPSRRRLWALLAELPATTTVLLVTHDLAPGTFAATRAVLVDRRLEELALDGLHEHPLLCGHGHG